VGAALAECAPGSWLEPRILVSAGDASGDACAAELVRELRARRPGLRCFGLGGAELERAGAEILVPQRELAVGGLAQLVPELPRVVGAWRTLLRALRERRPQLALLVDSAGFNLPLARRAQRQGVATLYYVCPQVWAWRRGRMRKLARRADRLALILPFEPAFYRGSGARASYVGHPILDRLAARGAELSRERARASLGLPAAARVIALLPGSRRGELRQGLDLFLETARRLRAEWPELVGVLPVAPSLEAQPIAARVRALGLAGCIRLAPGAALPALAAADAALVKPGTGALEAALLGVPLVVAGRADALSAAVARRLLRVESLALPNLILARPAVPEFLQQRAQPEALAAALAARLGAAGRGEARALALELRERLGPAGAARRAAALAEALLDERARA